MYMGDIWSDLNSVLTSGSQLVQAVRPPAPGTSPLSLPVQYAAPQQQRSILSDPVTLSLIALAGVAVIVLLMRR